MNLGDVILYDNKLYINLGISKNYEDVGSCSYDRYYELFPIRNNAPAEVYTFTDQNVLEVHITGMSLPFISTEHIPYNIRMKKIETYVNGSLEETCKEYFLRQKQPKIVYVYE